MKRTPQAVVYAAAFSLMLGLTVLEAWRWRTSSSSSLDLAAPGPVVAPSGVNVYLSPQPENFYRVTWAGLELPEALTAGESVTALMRVRNAGDFTWPDAQMADPVKRGGGGAVRIGYRWLAADEPAVIHDYQQRTSLPWPLRPHEVIVVPVTIQAPVKPARYRLQIDLVHELVTWFEGRGAERLVVPVVVNARD